MKETKNTDYAALGFVLVKAGLENAFSRVLYIIGAVAIYYVIIVPFMYFFHSTGEVLRNIFFAVAAVLAVNSQVNAIKEAYKKEILRQTGNH